VTDTAKPVIVRAEPVALSAEASAALLGMSLSHFKEHVMPDLPRIRSGRKVLYRRVVLERWAERNETYAGRRVA
jgi:hypothetical protein